MIKQPLKLEKAMQKRNFSLASWSRVSSLMICYLMVLSTLTAEAQTPLGTSFTYQGQLEQAGSPATGEFDFEFNLYDDSDPVSATLIGSDFESSVNVVGGLFVTQLDFGDVFLGAALWLEIRVRPAGNGQFQNLTPLQPLTASPNSLYTIRAGDADTLGGFSPSDFLLASGGVISGDLVVNGRLGIGEPNPSSSLEVNGAVELEDVLDTTGANFFESCPANSAIRAINSNGSVQCEFGSGGDNLGNHTANENLAMNGNWLSRDGDSEGIWISGNGRVGIGTSSPETPFHLKTSSTDSSNNLGDGIHLMRGGNGNYKIKVIDRSGVPHIDFTRATSDFDARIALEADNKLWLRASDLVLEKDLEVREGLSVNGDIEVGGFCFRPRVLVRCLVNADHHLTWVDNQAECPGVIEGQIVILAQC